MTPSGAGSSWVDCLVSIRFDLDIGPKIESVVPPGSITEEGKTKLLRCAFPDCNPDCGYNFIFYFTMPDCTSAAAQSFSQTVAPPTVGSTVPELCGAAFYRQKHDPNVPRHYVQQVLVLLSHLPYYNVHELILRVVAPRFCQCCSLSPDCEKEPVSSVLSPEPHAYFEMDPFYSASRYTQEEVLQEAIRDLSRWPSPHPQMRYTATLLRQSLVFRTPPHILGQPNGITRGVIGPGLDRMTMKKGVGVFEATRGSTRWNGGVWSNDALPLFSLLGEQLHHLTFVWELLLRHEPLLILSNTPSTASAAAFSVASLVLPVEFNGVLRSYFTVQNEDFPRLSRMGRAMPFPTDKGILVAGTNPFLLRSFSGWPSLMVVMDRSTSVLTKRSLASPLPSKDERDSNTGCGVGAPLPDRAVAPRRPATTVARGPSSFPSPSRFGVASPDESRARTPPLPAPHHARDGLRSENSFSPRVAPSSTSSPSSSAGGPANCDLSAVQDRIASAAPRLKKGRSSCSDAKSRTDSLPTSEPPSEVIGAPFFASSHCGTAALHTTYDLESTTSSSCDLGVSPVCYEESNFEHAARQRCTVERVGAESITVRGLRAAGATQDFPCQRSEELEKVAESQENPLHYRTETSSDTEAPADPVAMVIPSPVSSSVTLFTMDTYLTTVESVRAVQHRKRGGAHQSASRASLQQHLHNYFDSSVDFLLNHADQTELLLERLEMISHLDAEAQRTSVSLSLAQLHGAMGTVSSPLSTATRRFSASPSPAASSTSSQCQRQQQQQWNSTVALPQSDVTSCSHCSVADDIVRKFFTSLTSEFLTPIDAWFQRVTARYTAFHLCDRDLCESLLAPANFLDDFARHHRHTAPSMWTKLHPYKTYKVIYERFAGGCLFKAYIHRLLEENLRRELDSFQVEEWVARVPSDAERIDVLINLLNTVQRELTEVVDPDLLFVTSATVVLASMAVMLQQPHREQFMLKIGELQA